MSSIADSAYRLLLRALPADLRQEFGAEMEQLFRDHRQAERGRPVRMASLWCAAIADVVREAAAGRATAPRRQAALPAFSWRSLMRALVSDLRHGLRLLRRYPSTSILAVATLALGIGANTAIFSVVDAVVLQRLPYSEPDRLVMVWEKRPRENVLTNVVAPADFLDWQRRQVPFDQLAALVESQATLTGQGEPRRVGVGAATAAFFDVLRVPPALGRTFRAGEDVLGKHRVVVLTHGIWHRVFGGDASIVGRNVILNGNAFEVIGVLPASFRFVTAGLEIWVPMVLETAEQPAPRASHQLDVYARLKAGVTLDQARDAMARLAAEIEAEHLDTNRGHGAWITTMRDEYVGPVRTQLVVIFAAVGLVLLIACANVANLLLVRAAGRRREMAVRSALGAARARLMTQSLGESLAVALAGGVAGLAVALALLQALPLVLPEQLSVVEISSVGLDARVLLFAFGLTLATGLLFGWLPAFAASRPDLAATMKEGGRGPAGVRKMARRALVVSEVALATLALVGGGLVLRSFATILAQPLGFDTRDRMTVAIDVPNVGYASRAHRVAALVEIEQRLTALPGVTSVGGINLLPLQDGDSRTGIEFESREPVPDEPPTRMHPRIVTPGYFGTMGIPIVRGRGLTAEDHVKAEPIVVVSEAAVKRFWPNADPIGQRIRFNGTEVWRRVVGIAGDVRHWGLTRQVNPMLYWPHAQAEATFLVFVIKGHTDPISLSPAVRAQVAAVDPKLPAGIPDTMAAVVAKSIRAERAQAILMGAFAVTGLLLAVIGIYGVMSQLVVVRVPEIGIRMTLGARPGQVLRQLLAEGFWQSAIGLAIGLAAGAYLMRLAQTLLFQTSPWDPLTLAAVSTLLIGAALAACFIPARRAMRVDPVDALRQG